MLKEALPVFGGFHANLSEVLAGGTDGLGVRVFFYACFLALVVVTSRFPPMSFSTDFIIHCILFSSLLVAEQNYTEGTRT